RVFTYKYCLRQKIIVAGLAAERQAASERRPRSSESGRSDQDAPQMGWVRKGASQTCWRPARRIADSYDHSHLVARRRADDLPPVVDLFLILMRCLFSVQVPVPAND